MYLTVSNKCCNGGRGGGPRLLPVKKLKIMCGSVLDPFETGNAVVPFRSQRPPTQSGI
jgi:hypothetical protein